MGVHFQLESDQLRLLEAIYEENLSRKWHLHTDWRLATLPTGAPYTILNLVTGIEPELYFSDFGVSTLMEMARCGKWVLEHQEVCPASELPDVANHECELIGFDERKQMLEWMVNKHGWDAVKTSIEMLVRWCELGIEFDACAGTY